MIQMIENNISKLLVITVSNEFILSKQTVLLYDSLMGSIVNPVIDIFLTYPLTSCITLKIRKFQNWNLNPNGPLQV